MGCSTSKDGVVLTGTETGHSGREASNGTTNGHSDLPDDRELELAATKIQATFRGHRARKQQVHPSQPLHTASEMSAPSDDIDLNDPELEAAATKIQATFRGHRVRKDDVVQKEEEQLNDRMGKLQTEATKPEEEIDIDLEDPEVMKAASKIQASFRAQFGKKK